MTRIQIESRIARCDREIAECRANYEKVREEEKWMVCMGELDWSSERKWLERQLLELEGR